MALGYAASGFAIGHLVGMTGIGGGSLMTPLLILLFGIHPTTAGGTGLLFPSATKAAGAIIRLGVRIAPEPLLRIGLAVLLAVTGLRLLHG